MGRLSPDGFEAVPAPMRVADAAALIRARLPVLSGTDRLVERADHLTEIRVGDGLPYRSHGDLG